MDRHLNIRLSNVILVAILLAIFSYFVNHPFPTRWLAFACITFCAWMISRGHGWAKIIGTMTSKNHLMITLLLMGSIGTAGASYLRYDSGLSLLPVALTRFAFLAVLIGSMEELVFRGWMYSMIDNTYLAIIIPAIAHAAYKACLFMSPMVLYDINVVALFRNTFLLGLLLGISRRACGSVWPAVAAHALFDLVVYGDAAMPWWVM